MSEDIIQYGTDKHGAIENFQKLLNQYPDKKDIAINTQAKNSKYLPIGCIERKLDEIYTGLWMTENFRWVAIANELVGSIDLKVFHPTAKIWLTRTGAAGTMIQMQAQTSPNIENKIKNTLGKDFPHLKAECIKNAAKSLGVVFGRNLNRNENDDYVYISEQVHNYTENQQEAIRLFETAELTDKDRSIIEKKIYSDRTTHGVMAQVAEYLSTRQKKLTEKIK